MKNKNLLLTLLVLIVLVIVFSFFYNKKDNKEFGYKNASYLIQGERVTLKDGVSFEPVSPESSFAVETRYFGNEVNYDFNSDGRVDTAFLLTQDMGGSGTFYYVVVALNTLDGYVGSEAMFLGDRIAPQTTEVKDGLIVVNYADRNPGEPFTTAPSVGKSIYVKFNPSDMTLGEVVRDFEGEADPKRMSLTMKTWTWVRTELNDGTTVVPKSSGKFNLTFKDDNTFSASTDCNGVGGEYKTLADNRILFERMISTLMYCEGSQEDIFKGFLQNASGYLFTSKGELVIELKYDSGSVVFN